MAAIDLLSAEWRDLVFLSYEVEHTLLAPWIPDGTELDTFNDKIYLSVVGLMNLNMKIAEIRDRSHEKYEQVNLRFYVRRKSESGGWNHGVVFIRQIVPEAMIALGARLLYNETYVTMPMRHHIHIPVSLEVPNGTLEYSWQQRDLWQHVRAVTDGELRVMDAGSKEEFLAHRLWGYSGLPGRTALEYHVQHPRWRYWPAGLAQLDCDIAESFGRQFDGYLKPTPDHAFVAEGSEVAIHAPSGIGAGS